MAWNAHVDDVAKPLLRREHPNYMVHINRDDGSRAFIPYAEASTATTARSARSSRTTSRGSSSIEPPARRSVPDFRAPCCRRRPAARSR